MLSLLSLAGCGGVRDVTRNKHYLSMSPFLPGHIYRLTRHAVLAPDGWLEGLQINPKQLNEQYAIISAGTRFHIDKVILDDRVASLQFHPLGVLLDGPYEGHRIDTIKLEEGWVVEDPQPRY